MPTGLINSVSTAKAKAGINRPIKKRRDIFQSNVSKQDSVSPRRTSGKLLLFALPPKADINRRSIDLHIPERCPFPLDDGGRRKCQPFVWCQSPLREYAYSIRRSLDRPA